MLPRPVRVDRRRSDRLDCEENNLSKRGTEPVLPDSRRSLLLRNPLDCKGSSLSERGAEPALPSSRRSLLLRNPLDCKRNSLSERGGQIVHNYKIVFILTVFPALRTAIKRGTLEIRI